ncbi:GL14051 [Drosophila persimilis]|uniref:GL14051 n=1 Tax=Drosophila persimilis TaxID=7234 RepID=B4GNM9_DROPE|nr:telomere-binding protein cav [Drosophila persimilis]EDW39355.1 GL14051 [Drosophila persimilis]
MARSVLSYALHKFQTEKAQKLMRKAKNTTDRELFAAFNAATKITSEDLQREYSSEEVKSLCLRTKVRVKMHYFNSVWDAKLKREKKGRLANKSDSAINAMLVRATKKEKYKPYTATQVTQYNHIAKCELKRKNNLRLDRWKRERWTSQTLTRSEPESHGIKPGNVSAGPASPSARFELKLPDMPVL